MQELIEFKDYNPEDPTTWIPADATNLNHNFKTILNLVFPIGSTYVTQDITNPSEILGFGDWVRFNGKVALGLSETDTEFNEIGKTGGEIKHIQTIAEMPSHNHTSFASRVNIAGPIQIQSGTGTGIAYDIPTDNAGGGQPFNILQPYEVVGYRWKRVA